MHICMITTTLPPVVGGLENHVWELSRHLVRAGHRVILIGSRNYQGRIFPAFEEKEGVRIYRVRDTILPVYYFRYRLFSLRAARLARKIHRRHHFDIIHAHQIYPCGVAGAFLRHLLKIPLVVTCHGSGLFLNWEVPWIRPLMKWVMRRADRFIAVGNEQKEKLENCSVPSHRVTVLSNCVDTDLFSPRPEAGIAIRERYNWNHGETVVAFVGRFHPIKGPGYFLQAALKVHEKKKGIKFLLVGSGELEDALRKEVALSGRSEAFAFTGDIPHEKVPDYMNAADILVLPSLSEGSPLALIEAMAMGKAVIASRVGSMPDYITDGETGILVDRPPSVGSMISDDQNNQYIAALVNAINRLAEYPDLRLRMGQKARREVKSSYDWNVYIPTLVKIYEVLIKKENG